MRKWNFQVSSDSNYLGPCDPLLSCIVVTSDSNNIIFAEGGSLVIQNGDDRIVLKGYNSFIEDLAITNDNKYIVSGSQDKIIGIWNLHDRKQVARLYGHTSSVDCIAISSDNKYIISSGIDNTMWIWSLQDHTFEDSFKCYNDFLSAIAITFDKKYVLSCGKDKTISLWNIQDRKQVAILRGHSGNVHSIAVMKNNKYIASGSVDNTVRIWNIGKIAYKYEARLLMNTSVMQWEKLSTDDI